VSYRHVLVGTDGSPSAAEAVRHAAGLAAALGAKLTIVAAFVPRPYETARARAEAPDEIRWRIIESAAAEQHVKDGRQLAVEAGATDIAEVVVSGDPAEAVIATAEAEGADVIVVGSKGMTSAKRFLLGSVPNKISHHAPCDVIIVRTER
jgi:nucleotide-binding universal stress UspA family protein